jgi:hypothetical protein
MLTSQRKIRCIVVIPHSLPTSVAKGNEIPSTSTAPLKNCSRLGL